MTGAFRRYELGERIGVGGMAEVFKAVGIGHDGNRSTVVVKRILPHLSEDPAYRQMFVDEAKIASTLDHPNIVRMLDLGRMDDQLFLALEFVDGGDLAQLLRRARDKNVPVGVPTALSMMVSVLEALHYAHTLKDSAGKPLRIVHRDVSPSNVLVSRDGHTKVTDFGVAKATVRGEITVSGVVKGNARFMAPEQVTGRAVDGRTDVFGAGILMLTILCGKHPLEDEPLPRVLDRLLRADLPLPSSVVPSLPKSLDAIVLRATRPEALHRYPSAIEFAGAIQEFAESNGISLAGLEIPALVDQLFPPTTPGPLREGTATDSKAIGAGRIPAFPGTHGETTTKVRQEEPSSEGLPVFKTFTGALEGVQPPPTGSSFTPTSPTARPALESPWGGGEDELSKTLVSVRAVRDDVVEEMPTKPNPTPKPKNAVSAVSLVGHRRPVAAIALTGDGRHVVSAGHDQTVRIWDLVAKSEARQLRGHTAAVTCLALSPDGTRIVTGARDKTVRLWDFATGALKRELQGHEGWVFAVGISPDGKFALSSGMDKTIRLWHLDKGKTIASLFGHLDTVSAVAFLPDGLRAVSAGYDRLVKVWTLEHATEIHSMRADDAVRALAISPDGKTALTAGADLVVTLWDVDRGVAVDRWPGHREAVVTVGFSPDGTRAISGSYDGTVKLWDVTKGTIARTYVGHNEPVLSVVFTPDGTGAVSGSADGTIRIWTL